MGARRCYFRLAVAPHSNRSSQHLLFPVWVTQTCHQCHRRDRQWHSYNSKGYSVADRHSLFPETDISVTNVQRLFPPYGSHLTQDNFMQKGRLHILCWLSVGEVDISDERGLYKYMRLETLRREMPHWKFMRYPSCYHKCFPCPSILRVRCWIIERLLLLSLSIDTPMCRSPCTLIKVQTRRFPGRLCVEYGCC